MDRGYESYNLMAHFQEKGWLYVIRIRDGKQSMHSSFNLPNTECFDQTFSLTLSRKQTKQFKKLYLNCPNEAIFQMGRVFGIKITDRLWMLLVKISVILFYICQKI